jgi:hypothetical protein
MRRLLPLGVLVAAAFLAGRFSRAGDEKTETVLAKRYQILWVESAMDASHGGGQRIHEFFFPDSKLVAGVRFEHDGSETGERAHVYARASEQPRNDLTGFHGEGPSAIEDVRVPVDLVQSLEEYAKLTQRWEDDSVRLGEEMRKRLSLEPIQEDPK